jgi:hypothetical protein
MHPPTLIGIVSLPFGRVRRLPAAAPGTPDAEVIERVAFDSEGRAWGLVMTRTRIPDVEPTDLPGISASRVGLIGRLSKRPRPRSSAARLNFDRWVRFDAIPFAPDEIVTAREWTIAPDHHATIDD